MGGTVEFEFKRSYKTPRASQQTTLGQLRFERLNKAQSVERRVIIEPLSSQKTAYSAGMMTTTKDGFGIQEGTIGEAVQIHNVPEGTGAMLEIPKSPWTPRPKKNKKEM